MRKKIGYLFAAALTAACVLSVVPEVSVMASDTQEVSDAEYKPEIGSTSWVLLEKKYSSGDGSIESISESHEYDPATGYEIKYNNGGTIYTYDRASNGYITKSEEYSSYDRSLRSTTEYDENNHKTIAHLYNSGEPNGYITYEYDPEGKETGRQYDANGEYIGYIEREYWTNGEVKRQYSCDEHGTSMLVVNNEQGDIIEFQLIEHGSETSHWKYTYENGRPSYYESHVRGQEDTYSTYAYEDTDNGYIATITQYDSNNNVRVTSHTTFEFDENGNLVRETVESGFGFAPTVYTYTYLKKEFDTRGHYIPNFDAYRCDEGCVFNYRLYNPNSGEHFYTGSRKEALILIEAGWNFEGPGFVNPTTGNAVYRLYNSKLGDHLYTNDVDEINSLINGGDWKFDDGADGTHWVPAFPSADSSTGKPMYRLYNPNAWDSGKAGAFHFTMSKEERDHLKSLGWIDEGIGWYSV